MSETPYDPTLTFEGRLRGKSLRDGSVDASLEVRREGLTVRADAVGEQILSYRGMRLRRDEGGALVATGSDRAFSVSCMDPGFERALETMAGNDLNQELTRLAGHRTSSRSKHRLGCLLVLIFLGLFLWALPRLLLGTIESTVSAL
ncbi:MAG: hypothetical protein KDB61_02110, partial [Planctomycetes bacterium]|nr:hypothetical protein [Planctomycetota bacterium]